MGSSSRSGRARRFAMPLALSAVILAVVWIVAALLRDERHVGGEASDVRSSRPIDVSVVPAPDRPSEDSPVAEGPTAVPARPEIDRPGWPRELGGFVVRDGRAVPRAIVEAWCMDDGGRQFTELLRSADLAVASDQDGRFEFVGLVAGARYALRAADPRTEASATRLDVVPGDWITLALPVETGEVFGTMASRRPVEVLVRLQPRDGPLTCRAVSAPGAYRLAGLPIGTLRLEFHAGSVAVAPLSIDLEAGDPLRLDIELDEGASIEGVVTTESGAPIADALISVDGQPLASVRSDAAGVVVVDGIALEGSGDGVYSTSLRVRAPDFAPCSVLVPDVRRAGRVCIVLVPESVLEGRVVDESGGGIPHARLLAWGSEDGRTPAGHRIGQRVERRVEAWTDARGEYRLSIGAMRNDALVVLAIAPGRRPDVRVLASRSLPAADDGRMLRAPPIVLAATTALRGRVTDDAGRPVPGARVTLAPSPVERPWDIFTRRPDARALDELRAFTATSTDDAGEFRLTASDGRDAATGRVRVEALGFPPFEEVLGALERDGETVLCPLQAYSTCRLRLVDRWGRALRGATARVGGAGQPKGIRVADAQGRIEVLCAPGVDELEVAVDGWSRDARWIDTAGGDQDWVVRGGVALRGTGRDGDVVTLSFATRDEVPLDTTPIGSDGTFEWKEIPPGRYLLRSGRGRRARVEVEEPASAGGIIDGIEL